MRTKNAIAQTELMQKLFPHDRRSVLDIGSQLNQATADLVALLAIYPTGQCTQIEPAIARISRLTTRLAETCNVCLADLLEVPKDARS